MTDEYESIQQEEKDLENLNRSLLRKNFVNNFDKQEHDLLEQDLMPETAKLIEYYQELIKRQENFYEEAFDVVEELEKEENLQKDRIKTFQKQIKETEIKVKQ